MVFATDLNCQLGEESTLGRDRGGRGTAGRSRATGAFSDALLLEESYALDIHRR